MIVCRNCQHREMVGALFCSECGSQLFYSRKGESLTFVYSSEAYAQVDQNQTAEPGPSLDSPVSLKILATGEIIPLPAGSELTLGRMSEGQPVIPDIDLTPFKAYGGGVSRLHASIHIQDENVFISDLGSSNGTRVNGRSIPPHTQHSIYQGDILSFGKFEMQLMLNF